MAIYPILPGQKTTDRNVIPPHNSGERATTTSKPAQEEVPADLTNLQHSEPTPNPTAPPPAAALPPTAPAPAAVPPPVAAAPPAAAPPAPAAAPVPEEIPVVTAVGQEQPSNDSNEIHKLLSMTGQKAPDGPLIDFAGDLKKDLPQSQPAQLHRSQTEDSNDAFFDAES